MSGRGTTVTVRERMNPAPRTLGRNDSLRLADDLLRQERIRHLPVLDGDGVLCGIVSQRDLFRGALLRSLGYGSRVEERMLDTMHVKDAMTDEVHTIGPDASMAEAGRRLLEHRIGCLPVVENDALVGILTESDFVALVVGD